MTVLIAGAGIAGLTLGLTCHQLGIPFQVFESAQTIRPLGVGINIQPNAVRELFEMGFERELSEIGVETQEYGMFSKTGQEIWIEPRGKLAGYSWPQFSIHRGRLQMMLYEALLERAGADCVMTGAKVTGFGQTENGVDVNTQTHSRHTKTVSGKCLIAADGIHSAIRAQLYPNEGAPLWNGAVLWRGTTRAQAFRTGASMALIGHETQRFVCYPISKTQNLDQDIELNWIAELKVDPSEGWRKDDWNHAANKNDFAGEFTVWNFDWLNVPQIIEDSQNIYEYPMIDRDPLDQWTFGDVTLIGDAAHATYPVGSSGASQAIIDARRLGAAFQQKGVSPKAMHAYEAEVRPLANQIVRANRGNGPDAVLQWVEDACQGAFENIDDVISIDTLSAHAAKYKKIAGFSINELNALPSIISQSSRI